MILSYFWDTRFLYVFFSPKMAITMWKVGSHLKGLAQKRVRMRTPSACVTAIAAGSFHSLALKSDGTVVNWALTEMERLPFSPA